MLFLVEIVPSTERLAIHSNSIVKTSKPDKFFVFLIDNTNKHIQIRKGSEGM